MPKMICKEGLFCPGDSPLANFSAEAPDTITFFDIAYSSTPPNLGSLFTATGCVSLCESTISQDDADQCAARQAYLCGIGTQDPVPSVFYNGPQQCSSFCPDGLPFTIQVPGGLFVAAAQTLADQQALQYACALAKSLKMCMGSLPSSMCSNTPFSQQISVTGGIPPITFIVASGILPTGFVLSASGLLSGTPTSTGQFSFLIRASSANGVFMQKAYSISCVAISTPSPLPTGTIGTAYSVALAEAGGSPISWSIKSGSLPPGLSLSSSGVISGTPTTVGTYTFTVQIADSSP